MFVLPLVFAIVGFTTKVACFPANDLAFPGPTNAIEAAPSGEDRFRQLNYVNHGNYPLNQRPDPFRPPSSRPGDAYRPPSSRPNGNSRPLVPQQPGQGSQPSFLRPDDFKPPGSRPSGISNPQNLAPNSRPRPNANFRPEGTKPVSIPSSFQPDFLTIGTSSNSVSTGSSNTDPVGFPIPDAQASSTEGLEASTVQSTTKIPRRDPTYRIISTSPCPCSFTRQYSPVCGTDGQTYLNIAILQCAQTCGTDVKVFLEGSCGRNNGHVGAIDLHYR